MKNLFVLKSEHLKLLSRLYFNWDSSAYEGAPAVNIKRPYGNSSVYNDIAEILGWKLFESSDGEFLLSKDQLSEAKLLHSQMPIVLQIISVTQQFETGEYFMESDYDVLSWKKVK